MTATTDIAGLKGCRKVTRDNIPGNRPTISSRPGEARGQSVSLANAVEISPARSKAEFSTKSHFVSPCAPTALAMNCGKFKAKNSHFFIPPKYGKSLGNQPKTVKKMSPICRNYRAIYE